jgi:hypothetical protein
MSRKTPEKYPQLLVSPQTWSYHICSFFYFHFCFLMLRLIFFSFFTLAWLIIAYPQLLSHWWPSSWPFEIKAQRGALSISIWFPSAIDNIPYIMHWRSSPHTPRVGPLVLCCALYDGGFPRPSQPTHYTITDPKASMPCLALPCHAWGKVVLAEIRRF